MCDEVHGLKRENEHVTCNSLKLRVKDKFILLPWPQFIMRKHALNFHYSYILSCSPSDNSKPNYMYIPM